MTDFDLAETPLRELNAFLHRPAPPRGGEGGSAETVRVFNPNGLHSIAVGLDRPLHVEVLGPVGYYCAGMNKTATVVVHGHAGPGVAENIMSGTVRVKGNVSQYAAASGRGGLVVVEGDAATRCGISMKGVDIVVAGSVGAMSAFLAQRGRLVVLGDAGANLGDSLYEAEIWVRGRVESLGSDCMETEASPAQREALAALLAAAQVNAEAGSFRRYASAKTLYNFDASRFDHY